jgi:hypothetical protein
MPGFRRWQSFRAIAAPDTLIFLVDWDSEAELRAALAVLPIEELSSDAARSGFAVSRIETLHGSFRQQLHSQTGPASLLRLSTRDTPAGVGDSDRRYSLRALAAPSTTNVAGAHDTASCVSVCRIDFEDEDGLWHFLESPLRKAWSAEARSGGEEERWALNLPRLEFDRRSHARAPRFRCRVPAQRATLSVQLETGEGGRSARIKLEGRVDPRGSTWCGRICESLLSNGCLRLEVDVSELAALSPAVLAVLTTTARTLRERGGHFVLTDDVERVKRVTRSRNLEASLR